MSLVIRQIGTYIAISVTKNNDNNNNNNGCRWENSPIRITGDNAATAVDESSNTCTDHTTAINRSQHGPAPPRLIVNNIVPAAELPPPTTARPA